MLNCYRISSISGPLCALKVQRPGLTQDTEKFPMKFMKPFEGGELKEKTYDSAKTPIHPAQVVSHSLITGLHSLETSSLLIHQPPYLLPFWAYLVDSAQALIRVTLLKMHSEKSEALYLSRNSGPSVPHYG